MEKEAFFAQAKELIECCDWYYLTTFNSKLNTPETRAMANMRSVELYPENLKMFNDDDLSNYIVTSLSSGKVQQMKDNQPISIYYFCPKIMKSITLFGTAELIFDREFKNKLWQDEWKMYFELGSEDPDYAVLKFIPTKARYATGMKNQEIIELNSLK